MQIRRRYKLKDHGLRGCPHAARDAVKGGIVRIPSPELFCKNVSELFPPRMRVLHFVRRPSDMVLSSFLYHVQNHTPEAWVHKPWPCQPSKFYFAWVAPRLHVSRAQVQSIVDLCRRLSASRATFYGNLRHYWETGNLFDGLRLEASRELIHGDLMR